MDRKEQLARLIVEQIKEEFKIKHLSLNLVNTIKVYSGVEGSWFVEIPAEMYDFKIFRKSGAVVPIGKGSYASKIDNTGGFSGTHKDYIDRCINKAIQIWLKQNNINGKVT